MILILWMKALIQKYCLYFTGKIIWNRSNSLQLSQNLTADSLLIYKFCTTNLELLLFGLQNWQNNLMFLDFTKHFGSISYLKKYLVKNQNTPSKLISTHFLRPTKMLTVTKARVWNLVLHNKKRYVFWLQTITFTLF